MNLFLSSFNLEHVCMMHDFFVMRKGKSNNALRLITHKLCSVLFISVFNYWCRIGDDYNSVELFEPFLYSHCLL